MHIVIEEAGLQREKDEGKIVEHIKQCKSKRKLKVRKGKGAVCVVLGAHLPWAQREVRRVQVPERVACVEYAVVKAEKEVCKAS